MSDEEAPVFRKITKKRGAVRSQIPTTSNSTTADEDDDQM